MGMAHFIRRSHFGASVMPPTRALWREQASAAIDHQPYLSIYEPHASLVSVRRFLAAASADEEGFDDVSIFRHYQRH